MDEFVAPRFAVLVRHLASDTKRQPHTERVSDDIPDCLVDAHVSSKGEALRWPPLAIGCAVFRALQSVVPVCRHAAARTNTG